MHPKIIESVQHRAACWIHIRYDPNTHQWTKSIDVCVEELKLSTLILHFHQYTDFLYLLSSSHIDCH